MEIACGCYLHEACELQDNGDEHDGVVDAGVTCQGDHGGNEERDESSGTEAPVKSGDNG